MADQNLGTLVINLKGNDSGFSSMLKNAGQMLGKFGKQAIDVVGRHNKEFKELTDTFTHAGVAIGLVADGILQFTGQGNLGMVEMVQHTRVLGREIGTSLQAGAFKASVAIASLTSGLKSRLLDFEEWLVDHPAIAALMGVPGGVLDTKSKIEEQRNAIAQSFDDLKRGMDANTAAANAEDDARKIVPDVSGAIDKEAAEVQHSLNNFAMVGKKDLAGFLAFSRAGAEGGGAAGLGGDGRKPVDAIDYSAQSSINSYFSRGDGSIRIGGSAEKSQLGGGMDAVNALHARQIARGVGPNNIRGRGSESEYEANRIRMLGGTKEDLVRRLKDTDDKEIQKAILEELKKLNKKQAAVTFTNKAAFQ